MQELTKLPLENLVRHVLILEKSGLPVFYRDYGNSPLDEQEQVLITGLLGGFINFSESLELGELKDVGFSDGRWFFFRLQDSHYLTICFNTQAEEMMYFSHERLTRLAQIIFDKLVVAFTLYWNMDNSLFATIDDDNLTIFQENFGLALDQILTEISLDFQLPDTMTYLIDLEREEMIDLPLMEGKSSTDISGLRKNLARRLKNLINGT